MARIHGAVVSVAIMFLLQLLFEFTGNGDDADTGEIKFLVTSFILELTLRSNDILVCHLVTPFLLCAPMSLKF